MKRITLGLGLLTACALTLGACGGSDELTGAGDGATATTGAGSDTTQDVSGVTIPEGVPGLTGDCRELYNAFIQGLASVGSGAGGGDVVKTFQALEDVVPDDLKDDAAMLGQAYAQYAELLNKYNGDLSKASVQEIQDATSQLSSDDVSAASENINAYFEATCPQG